MNTIKTIDELFPRDYYNSRIGLRSITDDERQALLSNGFTDESLKKYPLLNFVIVDKEIE